MLDRIDMTLFVDRVQNTDIHEHQVQSGKSSKEIKETIERALAFRKMREKVLAIAAPVGFFPPAPRQTTRSSIG